MNAYTPPWLDVEPSLFLSAMQAGANVGLGQRRNDLEANQQALSSNEAAQRNQNQAVAEQAAEQEQMRQDAERRNEFQAGQALQRDELVLRQKQLQAALADKEQQQNAAMALREAQLQNASQRISDQENQFGERQNWAQQLEAARQETDASKATNYGALNTGGGGALFYNKNTGEYQVIEPDAEAKKPERPYKIYSLDKQGHRTGEQSLTPEEYQGYLADQKRQKAEDDAKAAADLKKPGFFSRIFGSSTPSTATAPPQSPGASLTAPQTRTAGALPDDVEGIQSAYDATHGKAAMGGYKIGRKYSGMTYLGGDPNDENNWEQ